MIYNNLELLEGHLGYFSAVINSVILEMYYLCIQLTSQKSTIHSGYNFGATENARPDIRETGQRETK